MNLFQNTRTYPLDSFSVIGINYRKSDATIRSRFALGEQAAEDLMTNARRRGIPSCIVLSTCNRTEIYAICENPEELIRLLTESAGSKGKEMCEHLYKLQGREAVLHLFRVATGLDSQIIGDYEIIAQLKAAVKKARSLEGVNGMMERIINHALRASKEVKTKTKLSTGTVSVSYAAVEIIRRHYGPAAGIRVLLVGTGKFGHQIAGNLKEYFPKAQVTLVNRTDEKALHLAQKYQFQFSSYRSLPQLCDEFDVFIVNSSSPDYIISPHFFRSSRKRLILDLSMPANVDPQVGKLPLVTLQDVDEVSQILESTRSRREAEIPAAEEIIENTRIELEEWHRHHANHRYLYRVKNHLQTLQRLYFEHQEHSVLIRKTLSSLAIHLKSNPNKGCQCITALNRYLHQAAIPHSCGERALAKKAKTAEKQFTE